MHVVHNNVQPNFIYAESGSVIRVGERNKFTIEKLNSSRSALAEKGASDSEAHEFIARSVCGA